MQVNPNRIKSDSSPGIKSSAPSPRLRAVIALDDDEIGIRRVLAQLHRITIFRRVVASARRRIILEFDHDVARAGTALTRLCLTAAYQKLRPIFRECLR